MTAAEDWFLLDEADNGKVLILMPGGQMVIGRKVGDLFARALRGSLRAAEEGVPPTGETFNPADWLQRFTNAGGWYCVTDDGVHFGWPVPSVRRAMATQDIFREIEDQPDRHEAVAALVKERCLIG